MIERTAAVSYTHLDVYKRQLYVGVGSNSNITENGLEAEKNRAAIWEVDRATGR